MGRLLYIQASPLKGLSYSIAVADAFVEEYRAKRPGDEVVLLNVFEADLPPFDGQAARAKYAILHGQPHSEQELAAWEAVEAVIEQFKSADRYVWAVPMWNFGIPYRLKQYVDLLLQPGYTFSYSPEEGYRGLVTGRPAFVAYARGGEYAEGTDAAALDLQRPYVETVLRFMGFTDVRSVVVEPTLMGGPETAAAKQDKAMVEARKAAELF